MLDEAHERTLCTDMLAGLLKKVSKPHYRAAVSMCMHVCVHVTLFLLLAR